MEDRRHEHLHQHKDDLRSPAGSRQDDRKHALTIRLRSGDTVTAYGPIEVADRFMLCRLHDNNYEGNQLIALDTIEFIR